YWVQHGKADPVALVKRYAGRCPLLHMKDMAGGEVQVDVPVGTGILDMKGIIEVAKANDKPWFIVEQDNPQKPILWAVELSLKNMRRLLEK
ncbi:sugar phosphate isomerase/epimerase, partial [candidate division KSB1 bacterium]|nr:sugar phosphate isomerase/epimerase [candidate division KSB1 bacterium]